MVKFIVDKEVHCDGNLAIHVNIEPSASDTIWTGHLTIELLGKNSEILSREIKNVFSDTVFSKMNQLYYAESVMKNGSSVALTFYIRIFAKYEGEISRMEIEKAPEGFLLKNDNPVYIGKLMNLFIENESAHDIYLYNKFIP